MQSQAQRRNAMKRRADWDEKLQVDFDRSVAHPSQEAKALAEAFPISKLQQVSKAA